VLGKPFQSGLIFLGKDSRLPYRGDRTRCSTLVGSGLSHKSETKSVIFAMENTLAYLVPSSVTNKKFYSTDYCSTFLVLHSRVGSWPHPQTLDKAGKA
jgi:hypothetical protein